MEASFASDEQGMVAHKCGLRLDTKALNEKVPVSLTQKASTALQRHSPILLKFVCEAEKSKPRVKGPTIELTDVVPRSSTSPLLKGSTMEAIKDVGSSSTSPLVKGQTIEATMVVGSSSTGPLVKDSTIEVAEVSGSSSKSPLVEGPTIDPTRVVESSSTSPTNQQELTLENTDVNQSIAELDDIISDFQQYLDSSTRTPEFMEMKLADLVHPGRIFDLKDSLSKFVSSKNVFPNDMVNEMTKFSEMLNKNYCHRYLSAQEDIKEAEGKESSVVQLQNTLKQFTCELKPVKTKIEAIDGEIADLEKKLIEKKEQGKS
ncbi:hypothetical protein PanWU01x14_104180 [Parasponia andersonii]|uniref:Uncharacterized protein n=1 Tax=Parasponia andersonii TaxID=3476 RepID=A0A2P5D1T8_PARAD|nr:hypothetical protein PanWU01x14_104180 [Parasponia andersonii]